MLQSLQKPPSNFSAKIDLPASKSLSNRWLILNACMEKKILLHNVSNAADTVLMQELLEKISSLVSSSVPIEIDCRNAGTVLRFLTAYLSAWPGKWRVIGDERLSVRPIADLVDALKQLGADMTYLATPEKLPLQISGISQFTSSSVKLNMQKSSQFASALMLMISKFPNGLQIDFDGEVISKPYLEMTAQILQQCGVEVTLSSKSVHIKGIPQCSSEVFIESDWSSASYFYAFVALSENGTLETDYLYPQSLQGDCVLAQWFEQFGVKTTFSSQKVVIQKISNPLIQSFEMDFTDNPDLAQTMAILCATLNMPAQLKGLSSLRDKETDRLVALSQELNRVGATNTIEKDTLILYKHGELDFSEPIKTYNDHRMAMAFSIFSGKYDGVTIENPEVVIKSFPDFWRQTNRLK